MVTPKPRVLEYMFEKYLTRYIYRDKFSIDNWTYNKGKYVDYGKYEMEDSSIEFHLGDRWISGYDEAHVFTNKVTVPASFKGEEIRLMLNIGGEALVTVNGEIIGSSTTGGPDKHRETLLLIGCKPGDVLDIRVEAGINSGDFCDAAMDGAKSKIHTFAKAELVDMDLEAEAYYYDLRNAYNALNYITDEHIKGAVYRAIDDSLHIVDFDFEDERVRSTIIEARKKFLDDLGKIQYTPTSEVIFTGHSHIDVAWLWRIQESVRKSARTFSNVMKLMDKYPQMTFAQSQAVLYDMTKKYYPDVYEKIKEKVRNGQWDIVGNVWVEADTNIASGEALIRQLLYGREFFMKEFGVCSDTYWLPDCFGFSWALPQIIKKSGMKNFLTSKLNNNDSNRFPHTLFRWKGNSGDEITAYLQRAEYNGEYSLVDISRAETNDEKSNIPVTMAMYGHGDGGGGPLFNMLEQGKRLENFPGLPKTEIGHVDKFFEKVNNEYSEYLPVWNDEMYYENHRGTYTSQAFVKKYNRRNEYLLSRGEMLSLFAGSECGYAYPKEELEDCWKILLTNQFHDILPGSSIHEVYEDCRRDFPALTKRTTAMRDNAIAQLVSKADCKGKSAVVFNLTSYDQKYPVTVEVPCKGLCACDLNGNALPCSESEKDGKIYLTFTPDSLPQMSMKVFPLEEKKDVSISVSVTTESLENEFIKAIFNNEGELISVYDKVNGRETLDGKGNILTISQDKCVHETAWNLEENYKKKMWRLNKADKIEIAEQSAQRGALRIVKSFNKSTITQIISLSSNDNQLVFDTEVDWHETDKVLKAGFDLAVANTEATFDIAHGAIKRPTHRNNPYDRAKFEVCAHKWADLSEGNYGVSILNDCKYGYDVLDSHLRITLMRSSTCPDRTADHGINTFTYVYYPHAGSWQEADTVKNALALNIPPVAVFTEGNAGTIKEKSFLSIDCDNVIIDAFKKAQDGDGYIIRFVEEKQYRGKVNVKFNLPCSNAIETNLMEQDENEALLVDGLLSFNIKPFEVKTFRIK